MGSPILKGMEKNPREESVVVKKRLADERIDKAALLLWPYKGENQKISRGAIQKALEEGRISVNGAPVSPKYRVHMGDTITFRSENEDQQFTRPAGYADIRIISEEPDFLAVFKPAGVLTHARSEQEREQTLATWLLERAQGRFEAGTAPEELIVHRLDRQTSGLLLVARSRAAKERLQELFRERQVKKTYIALTRGHLAELEGVIDTPIQRKKGSQKRLAIIKWLSSGTPKAARTRYRVIARYPGFDIVLVLPETGRTHQIRAHMQSLGHPILGDTLYGGKLENSRYSRHMLHAQSLEFTYQEKVEHFFAPLPADFLQAIRAIDEEKLIRYDDEALQSIFSAHI